MAGSDKKIELEEYQALIALRDEGYPMLQGQLEELTRSYAQVVVTLADVMGVIRRIGGWLPTEDQAICRIAESVLREAGSTTPALFPEKK